MDEVAFGRYRLIELIGVFASAAANPGRVALSAMEAERRELSPAGFVRERLNVWAGRPHRGCDRPGPVGGSGGRGPAGWHTARPIER
jgi:hypothetical protein